MNDYSTVLRKIKTFLAELFTASIGGKEHAENWSASDGKWKPNGGIKE